MGMDVYGRRPSSESGEHFRASVRAWRPLHYLMREVACDLIDDETLMLMASNECAGSVDQDTCSEMADRLERWLNAFKGETFTRIRPHRLGDWFGWRQRNPNYEIHREHIIKFIQFLRHCGGFTVVGTAFVWVNLSLAIWNTPWHGVHSFFPIRFTKPFSIHGFRCMQNACSV